MTTLANLKKSTAHLSVLFVDDDEATRRVMLKYLSKLFLKVTTASNGVEGLDHYKNANFDIVITDFAMPKMNGLEMLKQIKASNKNQVSLIATGNSDSDFLICTIKIGVDGYLLKPFNFSQLNSALLKTTATIEKNRTSSCTTHLRRASEEKINQLKNTIDFQSANYEDTISTMVTVVEKLDSYTAGHCRRVADYCQKIATEMGYSTAECHLIYQAGMLHDIGKIDTPDITLLNPRNNNELECQLIREHVNIAHDLLNTTAMFAPLAEIIYAHHERHNGLGYPRGLKGNEIPPLARIMIVADVFDAITTNHIYESKKDVGQALIELHRRQGHDFDSDVVTAALRVLNTATTEDKTLQ